MPQIPLMRSGLPQTPGAGAGMLMFSSCSCKTLIFRYLFVHTHFLEVFFHPIEHKSQGKEKCKEKSSCQPFLLPERFGDLCRRK